MKLARTWVWLLFAVAACGAVEGNDLELDGSIDAAASDARAVDAAEARCGDQQRDPGEDCDGPDLGGATCDSAGFPGGTLACTAGCALDTSGCEVPASCDNGSVDDGEDCDGDDLQGATCVSEGFFAGDLACGDGCRFDTTGCSNCGNLSQDEGEGCDGTDFGGKTCSDLGAFEHGTPTCTASCTVDTASCIHCGDSTAEAPEVCDGSDLAGKGCADLGPYSGGPLTCNSTCTGYVTSSCLGAPSVPVLRAPLANAYVGNLKAGTRRPTFKWDAATTPAGTLRYELQYSIDKTFAAQVTTLKSDTTSVKPAADLPIKLTAPVGDRYYWRVRACAGNACSAFSPARYLNVGRSSKDFTGDGIADVIVGAPEVSTPTTGQNGRLYLYKGPVANNASPGASFTGEAASDELAGQQRLLYVGDLNSDGFADVATVGGGRVYVFLGNPNGNLSSPIKINSPAAGTGFGATFDGAGDVNGDGFDDLAVSADKAGLNGTVYVYLGSLLFGTTPAASGPGRLVQGLGDVNGDGYADVWIGLTSAAGGGVYLGGASPDLTPDLPTPAAQLLGAGDMNNDGYADFLGRIYTCDSRGLCLYDLSVTRGGPNINLLTSVSLSPSIAADGPDVRPWCAAGDLNGDGFADVATGESFGANTSDTGGTVRVYLGGATLNGVVDLTIKGATGDHIGAQVAGLGDVDGDGRDDLAADVYLQNKVRVYKGAATLDNVVDITLTGPSGGYFGSSID